MTVFSHERYCSEVVHQIELVGAALEGADLAAPVPTCPDWTLADLLHHLGQAHRMAAHLVATRATEFTPPQAGGPGEHPFDDAAGAARWLAEGTGRLADTLREAGPDAAVWSFGKTSGSAFWARRATHEVLVHRADVCSAVGAGFTVDPELAADCLDEWLDIIGSPLAVQFRPELKELLGPGRTLHLHATDTAPELNAEWLVDATGELVTWHRAHEKAAVAVRGPMRDLLLLFYRRLPLEQANVEVAGDRGLLELWLENAKF
ncbi:maleylpyruvate isomerase family mycothiol-dependent enzyme [Streptomyces sp. NPDC049577]|uniref:maleylpyruvate isomerase family mycothiol-dependent enzyme n=1 Tax=Streptomyces sp. NPDC049577 TaxID=3155153 RepID=UPI003440A220